MSVLPGVAVDTVGESAPAIHVPAGVWPRASGSSSLAPRAAEAAAGTLPQGAFAHLPPVAVDPSTALHADATADASPSLRCVPLATARTAPLPPHAVADRRLVAAPDGRGRRQPWSALRSPNAQLNSAAAPAILPTNSSGGGCGSATSSSRR